MGIYINKGNEGFRQIRNSEYIDKSGLIAEVNKTLFTEQKLSCVTRCRRFGKSMAAKMLAAYYDHSCDSRSLFADLQIASDPSFEQHLNKYAVIYVDMTTFTSNCKDVAVVSNFQEKLIKDIRTAYPQVEYQDGDHLMEYLQHIVAATGDRFFMIIDEWDAVCRIFEDKPEAMDRYLDLLRRMFKDVSAVDVFAGVYMTGILPIKKYNTQSALNNFEEYSMVAPGGMAQYFGFTREEVQLLAKRHGMDFDEMEKWYDGYEIGPQSSMFNPNSVMMAVREQWCDNYWGKTGATNSVAGYIQMNYDGLKDDIVHMLTGGRCSVRINGFQNDLNQFKSKDDVMACLIHMGYLGYDAYTGEAFIPNREVGEVFEGAIETGDWDDMADALRNSDALLRSVWNMDEKKVAAAIERSHQDYASIINYNDENALALAIMVSFYTARKYYLVIRELPAGKGFADIAFIPKQHAFSPHYKGPLPAMVVELKWNRSARAAIKQIKDRKYTGALSDHKGEIILVGINYTKKTKKYSCRIEKR